MIIHKYAFLQRTREDRAAFDRRRRLLSRHLHPATLSLSIASIHDHPSLPPSRPSTPHLSFFSSLPFSFPTSSSPAVVASFFGGSPSFFLVSRRFGGSFTSYLLARTCLLSYGSRGVRVAVYSRVVGWNNTRLDCPIRDYVR